MKLTPWTKRGTPDTIPSDFEDFFGPLWGSNLRGFARHLPEVFQRTNFPPINVAEAEDGYTVSIDCPGLERDEIDVELLGSHLIVRGERTWKEEEKKKEYHRIESQVGHFERTVPMPHDARLEPDALHATYERGVLTIEIPKVKKTPASKIPIEP